MYCHHDQFEVGSCVTPHVRGMQNVDRTQSLQPVLFGEAAASLTCVQRVFGEAAASLICVQRVLSAAGSRQAAEG